MITIQKHQEPWIDLQKLREEKGWLQSETADKLGFSHGYVSAVESGKRGFSKRMIARIIAVFNVKFEDFYHGQNDKP